MAMRVRPKGHWQASGLDHDGRVLYTRAIPPRREPMAVDPLERKRRAFVGRKAERRTFRMENRVIREVLGVPVR